MKRMFILSVVLIPFLCASLAFSQQPQKNSYDYGKYGAQSFPAREGSVDWGLALSGGGPRSALFSIGAMKALYDRDYLDKIDVISSTSGGSYASYWLLTSYDPSRRNEKFGAARLDNSKFLQQICFLQNEDKSNFLPILRSLGAFPTGDKRFKKYEDAIVNSFGYEITYGKKKYRDDTKLDFLNSSIDARDVPYFIINTTIGVKQVDVEKKELLELGIDRKEWLELAKVFEITPKYRGNVGLKFRDWAGKDNESSKNENYNEDKKDAPWTLSKSVATSGIPSFLFASRGIKHMREKERLMWDGGQAENLAAFGLISRGISNVIIVDSEQDARYKFEAYTKLQERLEKIDVSFCVPDIDAFLKKPHRLCREGLKPKSDKRKKWSSPVSRGKAKSIDDGGIRISSNIYYVKMSDPEAVLPEWFFKDEIFKKGKEYWREREDQRCPNGEGEDCPCEGIRLNLQGVEERKAFYTYRVRGYSEWLNGLGPRDNFKAWASVLPYKVVGKAMPFFSYNFPHTTTVELTFFANQLEAFVGLGYLQTMELKEVNQK